MEAKKNPVHDVHRQSFRFFMIGFAISVFIAIVAFEWTTEKTRYKTDSLDTSFDSYIEVVPSLYEPVKSPAFSEKKVPAHLINLVPISHQEKSPDDPLIINDTDDTPPYMEHEIDLENHEFDTTEIIILAEVPPVPVGGYEQFYTELSKNLKYPKQAIRHNVDGKVFVEFVVGRSGQINTMKVLKGIGSGCDEEALRVLALTEWKPGRQRGRPVNVRMVIPVYFKIQ
jgi:periplasmic protein TonB